jgi:hypothetical protein
MSNPDHSENKNSASKSDNNPDSTKFENREFQQDKIDSIKAFKKKPTRPGTLKKD